MVVLVKFKAMHTEEVGGVVIIDLRKITKPKIQGDNLVIHELKILLISMVVSSCAFSVNLSLV